MDTLDYKGFSYNMINKFFPTKRLSILAGFSSVGKTTFATNLAHPDFSVADLHRPCMTA